LPTDPRKLVNAHLKSTATAAYFNASWIPVRDAPGMRPAPVQYPKTCGEFRRAAAAGKDFLYGRQMFQILGTTLVGNVWEWVADWFRPRHGRRPQRDPRGPATGDTRVARGGSYLCHHSYCNRYRNSARMALTPDSSTGNVGFRVAQG
ncbi:MAG: formylglycine-rating enzyme, partial [Thermoleophilaceae bacterium]|nr:formylglycine-rating enzyme [Thermoleophilaceae bacterium]